MFRLGPDREIRRDRQPCRLRLAGSHAAWPRHHGGLRPAQERERQRTCFGEDGSRDGGYPIQPALPHAAVMGRILVIAGIILVAAGLLWPYLARLGLGRLPGDIAIRGEHGGFYFPVVTCLVVSLVLSLIFWLAGKL